MQKLCPLSFVINFFLNHKKIDAYIKVNYTYLHTFYIFYADFMKGYKNQPDGLSFLKKTNHGNFSFVILCLTMPIFIYVPRSL